LGLPKNATRKTAKTLKNAGKSAPGTGFSPDLGLIGHGEAQKTLKNRDENRFSPPSVTPPMSAGRCPVLAILGGNRFLRPRVAPLSRSIPVGIGRFRWPLKKPPDGGPATCQTEKSLLRFKIVTVYGVGRFSSSPSLGAIGFRRAALGRGAGERFPTPRRLRSWRLPVPRGLESAENRVGIDVAGVK
jgi:hypothetical protein